MAGVRDEYHFSMSIGKGLFTELLTAALPYKIQSGRFHLTDNLRSAARQLQVKQKVAGLLEGPEGSALVRVKDRAASVWHNRRDQVYDTLDKVLRVEGDWEVLLDADGSEFTYGEQEIGAEAYFKAVATGKAVLLGENLELPFRLEKRVGAEVHLGGIHYDNHKQEIVGQVQGVGVDLGGSLLLKLLNDVLGKVLEQQAQERLNPVTVLPKAQLDELVAGAATAIKLKMEVSDVALEVGEEMMTLKVRFGFTQLQLEDGRTR
ncbi:MAG: hypothetical protein VX899_18030 [Myxococcota bacterium]|nr:hypothetical protein [Myxococcota bacterium]